jgi:uncharacterized protein YeaO (DUF488 family)
VITLGSVYEPTQTDSDEFRVLVMRRWPRGIRKDAVDAWLKDASPSRELLRAYRDAEIGWDVFSSRYRDEILKERPGVLDELRRLEQEHGRLRLLCFERIPPAEHCHRQVLLALLNNPCY